MDLFKHHFQDKEVIPTKAGFFLEVRAAFSNQCFYHIETRQLICRANQLPGFYMMGTLAANGLKLYSIKMCLSMCTIKNGLIFNEIKCIIECMANRSLT